MKCLSRFLACLAIVAAPAAMAGGPIGICSNDAIIKYPGSGTVTLHYDQNTLGVWSNAQAATILNNARTLWNNVSTSTITLNRGPDLSADVTPVNYPAFADVYNDGINPVIYDADGSIIDTYYGPGNSAFILGFAGSAYFNAPTCTYVEGLAVINGLDFDMTEGELGTVLAHEIGHLIGLDHTQLDNTQGLSGANYPLMYPIAFRSSLTLHEDDTAAISALYPAANVSSNYGELTGFFYQSNGTTPVLGANLWVREVNTNALFSVVSDYRTQGTGYYRLLLPPGTYTIHAEPIQSNFDGGSGVGPYSDDYPASTSFQPPMYVGGNPIPAVTFGGGAGTQFLIVAGCAATLNWRLNGGGGPVGGNCVPATPTLTVTKAGSGTGLVTSSPAGINCGATCAFDFTLNQVVTLTAAADISSMFAGWSGACSGTSSTCTVTMSAARSVTATFAQRSQFQRAFLSATGDDNAFCTQTAPCRTLPTALAATTSGGEIWLMDPVTYNTAPVTINKSVTILSVPGKLASLRGAGGDALIINGAGIKVSLQNVNIMRETGSGHGINITNAAAVSIDNCTIHGFSGNAGVNIDVGGNDAVVSILNSVIRDNTDGLRVSGDADVTVEGSVLGNNTGAGVLVATLNGESTVNVTESVASGNARGFAAHGISGFTSRLIVRDSVASGNSTAGFVTDIGNSTYMLVSGSVAAANTIGFWRNAGTFESRGDNAVIGNATNTSGVITPVGGQ